jgi:hypothetical protein
MPSLIDSLDGATEHDPTQINELRLREEPATVLLFTDDADEARLHYEADDAIRSYIPCPGEGCPLCGLGNSPQRVFLLPVYNIETGAVEVLRIAAKRGPGSLGALLLPHLKGSHLADKLFLIGRNGMRYSVRTQPLAATADRGVSAIQAFLEARADGLSLVTAFPAMTAAEIADLDRVRRKLDAMGVPAPSTPLDEGIAETKV